MQGTPFNFEIECEVWEKSSPNGQNRRIGGFVSTDSIDRQGESVLQSGMDFAPFLKSGWFNDNHGQEHEHVVGYPEVAELRTHPDTKRNAWYVEGHLLKGVSKAESLWDLAQGLQKSGRKLGYSVEGSVLERDPDDLSKVRKAVVRNVAITHCPVNEDAALVVLSKSMSAGVGAAPVNTPVTGAGAAAVLAPESLEADGTRKKRKRKLKKSMAVEYLCRLNPKLTEEAAGLIVDHAIRYHAVA